VNVIVFLFGLLFVSLFICFYYILAPIGGYSQAESTIESLKWRLMERLERNADKLKIAGKSMEEVVKGTIILAILFAAIGFMVCLLIKKIYLAFAVVPLMFIAGCFVSEWSALNSYRKWQGRLAEGITILVDFMPAFLELPTSTTLSAIEQTVLFLPEPLKSEVSRLLDNIKRTGKAKEAFDKLSARAGERCIEAICSRLATAWDSTITPDIFDDLRDEVEIAGELAAARKTSAKSGLFAMIAVLGLFGGMLVAGYPVMRWILQYVSGGFGN